MRNGLKLVVVSCSLTLGETAHAASESSTDGPWKLESLQKAPQFWWLDEASPIRSLLYEGESYRGAPTEVFAFYATPGSVNGDPSLDHDLPAVVLVHGGGGTAFADWVWHWAKRGYAAIAMDLAGRQTEAPRFDRKTNQLLPIPNYRDLKRTRLKGGGPDQGPRDKFGSVGGDVHDDWPYHAIANVIRAHSLIRGFKEVDADRTAVTGISWGGYLTCHVASLDDRFKAAAPVYGCGFLYEGESVQKPSIDQLPPSKRALWIKWYDPASHLGRCRTPILFVNGTNDKHYPLNSYARSYGLVKGPRQLRIEVNMPHGHRPGWAPKEIGLFVDHYLRGGKPLAKLEKPVMDSDGIRVPYATASPLKSVALHFTTDDGPLVKRQWKSVPATITETAIVAPKPPPEATVWLITATDARDAMVSTEVGFPTSK